MNQSNQIDRDGGGHGGTDYAARLKQARMDAGLSVEEVSARLKMPSRVVRGLESGNPSELGAPIFVRGHARSYARMLGIDIDDALAQSEQVAPVVPPELVSHNHTPRYRHVFEQVTRRAVYVVLTAAIAIPVWMGALPHLDNDLAVQSLDLSEALPDASTTSAVADAAGSSSSTSSPGSAAQRTPVMASMTSIQPTMAQPTVAELPDLSMRFSGESWVQVFARDGSSLEQGLLPAGTRLGFDEGEVGRVVLGNIAAVEVRRDGEPVDLEPFSRANVARFTIAPDGSLAPTAQ